MCVMGNDVKVKKRDSKFYRKQIGYGNLVKEEVSFGDVIELDSDKEEEGKRDRERKRERDLERDRSLTKRMLLKESQHSGLDLYGDQNLNVKSEKFSHEANLEEQKNHFEGVVPGAATAIDDLLKVKSEYLKYSSTQN